MKLFIFGLGYSTSAFVRAYGAQFESVAATTRANDRRIDIAGRSVELHSIRDGRLDENALAQVAGATHLLISIPPDREGDPSLRASAATIERSRACRWIGYLSSVAVYGDHQGAWVDEGGALNATSARGRERIAAEREWLEFGARIGAATHVFRLAGIYGPGRNALVNLRDGKAKRLIKPGQIFNRIHVDDIAMIVDASIKRGRQGGIWNVADDEPAPPQDVVTFAAALLGVPPPPEVPFDAAQLTPMAASFYADNKRIANEKAKRLLGVALGRPTYREGLRALAAAGFERPRA